MLRPAAPAPVPTTVATIPTVVAVAAALVSVLAVAGTVRADLAPPPYAPGAAVAPTNRTRVRMVSERVLVTVADTDKPAHPGGVRASDQMVGHVEASFVLRNDGIATEAIRVRFPVRRDAYEWAISEGFQATVASERATIAFADGDGRPLPDATAEAAAASVWASFPAEFPVGVDVVVAVRYDVRPTGDPPYGTFGYVLDTGAAWAGTIGDAEVRVRLPYDVNEENAALDPEAAWDKGIRPPGSAVEGTDVVWRFTDLEPTDADNVRLTVLIPRRWTDLVAARAAVALQPADAVAQLALARALEASSMGSLDVGGSPAFWEQAGAAFLAALKLRPTDGAAWLDYAQHLAEDLPQVIEYGDYPKPLRDAISRGIELAPDDPRARDYRAVRDEWSTKVAAGTATPTPTPTPRPSQTTRPSTPDAHRLASAPPTTLAALSGSTAPPAEASAVDRTAGRTWTGAGAAGLLAAALLLLLGWAAYRRRPRS